MEFQPEKESWDSYKERLEHFFSATGMVDDDKKVFTLIHQNGPSLYTLLKELSFPSNPTQMSYDEIMNILHRHYVGAKSFYYERKVFYSAQMNPYESASDWHRRLRALAINCEFGGFIEEILVDKFITGFRGKVLQRLYEQNENITVQEALEIAQRYENEGPSERTSSENRPPKPRRHAENKKTEENVGRVEYETQKKPHQQHSEQRNQQKQINQNYREPQQTQQPRQQRVYEQQQGQPGRQRQPQVPRQEQQAYQQEVKLPNQRQQPKRTNVPTCFKCGKKGHYANVCHSRVQRSSDSDWEDVEVQQKPECCIS